MLISSWERDLPNFPINCRLAHFDSEARTSAVLYRRLEDPLGCGLRCGDPEIQMGRGFHFRFFAQPNISKVNAISLA